MTSKVTEKSGVPKSELSGDDGKIYVALQYPLQYDTSNLRWVLERNPAKCTIVFLYVDADVKNGVYETNVDMYMNYCRKKQFNTEKLGIWMEDITEGLKTLISQTMITKLVMYASEDGKHTSCPKKLSSSAISVNNQADPSCKIWFICHGNPIYTREATTIGFDKNHPAQKQIEVKLETIKLEPEGLGRQYTEARITLHKSTEDPTVQESEIRSSKYDIPIVSNAQLTEATFNFTVPVLGEGGFGKVYKAELWGTEVAIKMLFGERDARQKQTFQKEVEVLGKLNHPNLVRLIGACPEKFALVYEYMSGGSLEDRLVGKTNFPWQERIHIATAICKALVFLHSPKPDVVIHGDLKPANVLLDKNGSCKLGDFGICRRIVLSTTKTHHSTLSRLGTYAYLDPLFLRSGELSPKTDIYAFGMLLLRLLAKTEPGHLLYLEVEDAVEKKLLHDVLDLKAEWPTELAMNLCILGLKCCALKTTQNRPRSDEILEQLKLLRKKWSS